MRLNKYAPHLYVIPEDDADRQIADGFVMHPRVIAKRVQVMAPAGGWRRVLEVFQDEYVQVLQSNENASVVMLIDFDGHFEDRMEQFTNGIPEDLRSRVFLVGPGAQPEILRQQLAIGGFEAIGRALADECDTSHLNYWNHDQLRHNEPERLRLADSVKPFLFF